MPLGIFLVPGERRGGERRGGERRGGERRGEERRGEERIHVSEGKAEGGSMDAHCSGKSRERSQNGSSTVEQ